MRFLVIGGAGYIGSHFVLESSRQGHECVVYDNLSRGHRSAVPKGIQLVEADLMDAKALHRTLKEKPFDAIFHFAALALVGESVTQPDLYYRNNTEGVRILLDVMREGFREAPLIFSSTCAVFGTPQKLPIAEDDPKNPISPYGRSKLMAEWLMEDYCRAYGLKAMALRYFNACGAEASGDCGEDHQPETHLIPNILRAVAANEKLTIFGQDFPTKDGTCVRDYIHVLDLADAHIKAALYLKKQSAGTFDAMHLGTGQGFSNLEIVEATSKVIGKKIGYTVGERRAGDPPALFADNRKAKSLIGFNPHRSNLETIITSATKWHQTHPEGYRHL